jgi:ribosome-binding factor A
MPTHRVDKVAAQIQVEISRILASRLRDPRVGLISVVDVSLTSDLRLARVHVSTLGGDDEHRQLMLVLDRARGFIRRELAGSLRGLRRLPQIEFVDDRNIEYAVHIEKVIEQLHEGQSDLEPSGDHEG